MNYYPFTVTSENLLRPFRIISTLSWIVFFEISKKKNLLKSRRVLCACSTIIFSGWEGSSFSIYERVGVSVCVCVLCISVREQERPETRFQLGQRLLKAFAESIQKLRQIKKAQFRFKERKILLLSLALFYQQVKMVPFRCHGFSRCVCAARVSENESFLSFFRTRKMSLSFNVSS